MEAIKIIESLEQLSMMKGIKMVHLNIRSLFKKIDQLRILLHDSDIDFFTVLETWLKPHIHSQSLQIPGYELYRSDRTAKGNSKKRGGGLAMYISKKHTVSSQRVTDLDVSNEHMEAQWFLIHRPHCRNIVICNAYRPPSGDVSKAVSYLEDCVKLINTSKVNLFMLGDFNINLKNIASPGSKKLNFFIQSNGFAQHIKDTTRNTDKSNSLIDLAITNSKFINHAGTLEHYISDH